MQEAGDIKRAMALSGPCERVSSHWGEYRVRENVIYYFLPKTDEIGRGVVDLPGVFEGRAI
jgi:hypothetical protein